jgi:hypothetical protein
VRQEREVGRENEATVRLLGERLEGSLDVITSLDRHYHRLNPQGRGGGLEVTPVEHGGRVLRIGHKSGALNVGRDLLQQLQKLVHDRVFGGGNSGDVPAGPRETGHIALPERIRDTDEYGRNGAGLLSNDGHDPPARDEDYVRVQLDEIRCMRSHTVEIVRGPAFLDVEILTF